MTIIDSPRPFSIPFGQLSAVIDSFDAFAHEVTRLTIALATERSAHSTTRDALDAVRTDHRRLQAAHDQLVALIGTCDCPEESSDFVDECYFCGQAGIALVTVALNPIRPLSGEVGFEARVHADCVDLGRDLYTVAGLLP